MNEVLGCVISTSQHAFIKGRQILNCSLIANECLDSWTKAGIAELMCKIDMEKAYNHVNWNFLDQVITKMGFGRKWRFWIRVCISSVSYSTLIN